MNELKKKTAGCDKTTAEFIKEDRQVYSETNPDITTI